MKKVKLYLERLFSFFTNKSKKSEISAKFEKIKTGVNGFSGRDANLACHQVEAIELQVESIERFNFQSTILSISMIILAIVAISISSCSLNNDIVSSNKQKENVCYAIYKELSYNKSVLDMVINKKNKFNESGYVFLRDFEFRAYNSLTGNMLLRAEVAEEVMDSYRRLSIMQNSLEQARLFSVDSKKYHEILLENIVGANISIESSICDIKKQFNFK